MRYHFSLIASLTFLSLVVTGCGSSALVDSSDPGSTGASIARRDVRANAFPLETGRFLGFAESGTAFTDPAVQYSLEVVGPAPRIAAGAMEIVDPETRSYVVSDNRSVRILAVVDGNNGVVRRLAKPMRLITYPLRVGRFWEDRYGRGKKALMVRHWIADRLVVRTPEGSFDVFQIERRTWRGTYKPDFTADGIGRWTYYYAPGVGPVQIGTRWPGVTTLIYQLCPTRSLGLARGDAAIAGAPWRGLTAGLEPLVRE